MRRVHRKAAQGIPPRARSAHSPTPLVSSAVDQVQHSLRSIVSKALASSDSHPALADLLESCARLQQDLRNATSGPPSDQEEGAKGNYQRLSRILAETQASLFEHIKGNPALDPLKLKAGVWEAFSELSNRLFHEFVTSRRPTRPAEWSEMQQECAEVKRINEELLKELSDAQTESRKLMDFVSKLHEEKVTLSKRVAEGHTQAEFYKGKAKKAAEMTGELTKRNEELRVLNEAAAREIKALKEASALLKEDLAGLEDRQEGVQVEGLTLKLEARERDLAHTAALLQTEKEALASKTAEIQTLQSQLQRNMQEYQTLTVLVHTKDQALLSANTETQSVEKQRDELQISLKKTLEQNALAEKSAKLHLDEIIFKMNEEMRVLEGKLAKAKSESDNMRSEIAELTQIKAQNQTLSEELREERAKLQQRDQTESEFQLQIEAFKRKCEEMEKQMGTERSTMAHENEDLKQQLLNSVSDLKKQQTTISSLNAQIQAQTQAVDSLRKDMSTVQLEKQDAQTTKEALRQQVSASQATATAIRTDLERQVRSLTEELALAKTEAGEVLRQQVSASQATTAAIRTELEGQVHSLEEALALAQTEAREALRQQVSASQTSADAVRTELEGQVHSLNETLVLAKAEARNAKTGLEAAESELEQVKATVQRTERELRDRKNDLNALKKDLERVQEQEMGLKTQSATSQEDLHRQLLDKEAQVKATLTAKDQEIDRLQSQLDQSNSAITGLQQTLTENEELLIRMKEECTNLQRSSLEQTQHSRTAEARLSQVLEAAQLDAHKRESALLSQLHSQESELKDVKVQLESDQTAIQTLRNQLDSHSQHIQTSQSTFQAQIALLEAALSAASTQAKEAEAAKENLIDQLEDEKGRYRKLLEKSQTDLKKNFLVITQLEEQCQALQRGQGVLDTDLQTRLMAAESTIQESERKLKDALQLADQLCKAVEVAEADKTALKDQLATATGELKLVHSRARELENDLETMRQSAEQAEIDVRQAINDEEVLQSAYSQLQRDLTSLQQAKAAETAQRLTVEKHCAELESRVEQLEQDLQFGRQSGTSDEQESKVRQEMERLELLRKIEDLEMELDSFKFERQGDAASPRLSGGMDMDKRQVITTDLLDFEDESPLYSAEKSTPARMRVCKSVRHEMQIWCLLADQSDDPDYIWMKQEDIDPGLHRPPILDDDLEDQRQEFEEKLGEMEDELEAVRHSKERVLDILQSLLPCPADQDMDTYVETFLDAFKMQPFEAVVVGSSEDGSLAPEEAQSLLVTIKRLEAENEQLEQTLQLQEQQLRLLHEEHRARAEGETGQTPERHFAEIFANFARSLPQL